MKKGKVLILVIAAAAVGAGILTGLSGKEQEAEYESRPTVSAVSPGRGDILLYTELTGTIEPESKAMVLPKMGGEIMEVYFQAGDYVEAGTVLCKIDSDALTALKLQVEAASVSVADCNKNLSRTQALFAGGSVSQQMLEQAQNAAQSARISYDSAKNQYDLQLQYTTVKAPISGVIETRNIDPYQHIGTTSEICVISAKEQLQVKFGITEKTLSNLSLNDLIRIEKNGTEYQGVVTEISSMVNAASGLYDVKAAVPEVQGLTTGSRVKLTVPMSQSRDVMTVPLDVVRYDNGAPFVYRYEDGVAKKIYIDAGIYDTEQMEVVSGLDQNSLIISTWSNELVDGEEVILKDQSLESEAAAEIAPAAETE
ncbi:MAG: efflux RND transporter periplasmic adaptor subunit [Lachnospiraceae bacterium]